MQALGASQLHKMLEGFEDKSAQAVCTFGYCAGPGHEPVLFQGRTDGTLVPSRGSTVFGELACVAGESERQANTVCYRLGFLL
jgi:inosine triphosphate pyrophosphatase